MIPSITITSGIRILSNKIVDPNGTRNPVGETFPRTLVWIAISGSMEPITDLNVDKNRVYITYELPGISKDDVGVRYCGKIKNLDAEETKDGKQEKAFQITPGESRPQYYHQNKPW